MNAIPNPRRTTIVMVDETNGLSATARRVRPGSAMYHLTIYAGTSIYRNDVQDRITIERGLLKQVLRTNTRIVGRIVI